MNLIGAILVNLWVAGWVVAAVRAALKARAAYPAGPSRPENSLDSRVTSR